MSAPAVDLLFVDWLNDLVYRFETAGIAGGARQVTVTRTATSRRCGVARRRTRSAHRHPIRTLVKAATYHALEVRRVGMSGTRRSCSTCRGQWSVGTCSQWSVGVGHVNRVGAQHAVPEQTGCGYRGTNMKIQQIDAYRWRIPREGGMRVDGLVYADERMMADLRDDQSLQQVANVAHLPGIVGASLAMPDIHWGYGFPIGGVAAMDADEGVVSPGGRRLRHQLRRPAAALRSEPHGRARRSLKRHRRPQMYRRRPDRRRLAAGAICGLDGPRHARRPGGRRRAGRSGEGFGRARRPRRASRRAAASPAPIPTWCRPRALERGATQLGTLGSGNHFVEVQYVDEIYDERAAEAFGLFRGPGDGHDPQRLARPRAPGVRRSPQAS